ncbi:eukaryotic translation initiation factor 2 alpha [Cystoisospora suis]|uniref:Eukaryotic translation initiation factor 2 alpha n=1 Tax=Cystoisospora suis TaxID=483139 RepID=A0A2C6KSY8_9APIC|nr:eukaryotic translation initiation factor 2 alpha [Cystoisospora suis]
MRPDEVFAGLEVDEDVRKSLIQDIQLRLAPQALKLRARVDVWCFGKEGIDAVKAALQAGQEVGDKEVSINIKLIAPPQYVVVTSCYDKELGMKKIEEAMRAISDRIKSFKGGDFKQQGEIVVMGGEEERRLEELLEEEEDEETSEEEEEDEGMGRVEGDIPEDEVAEDDDDEGENTKEAQNSK